MFKLSSSNNNNKTEKSIYAEVTDIILQSLKEGNIPWQRPFAKTGLPANFTTKEQYKGINVLLLNNAILKNNYESKYFLGFVQVQSLQGMVNKGEKAHPVVYFTVKEKEITAEEKDEIIEKRPEANIVEHSEKEGMYIYTYPVLKRHFVFNVCQTNLKDKIINEEINEVKISNLKDDDKIQRIENFLNSIENKPKIINTAIGRACYIPSTDTIQIPKKSLFVGIDEYYSTLFHELVHSTLHDSRLNRKAEGLDFGSQEYAKEELIAELGSAFLCWQFGIQKVIQNQAAYIKSWIQILENDKKILLQASKAAQKAVEYLNEAGRQIKKEDTNKKIYVKRR
ncbi:ssDNA-binding domain-containing protein [Deferribacterales bacterium Es71-Z0220]|uniref:ArdC family protein n=1 Tax=Deferrivibrio essentukiensis TaxID=2880922 RepID=UPI001F60CCBE|nr:zincin-like metallopeptidase domain-containing protein [Deferrivibrio essentukiensis]MCB4204527.1 ssDNA-binding domain-containing protein [Deferrivibrio essentukiensis]